MNKKKLIVALLLVICLLGIVLVVGCGEKTENNDVNDNDKSFMPVDEEVFAIETPYCNLYYPLEWEENTAIQKNETEEGYKVEFCALVDGESIPIFDINFNSENGDELGKLIVDDKTVKVSVVSYNPDVENYSENKQMDISEMIHDINVIISKLIEEYEFELI